jgi:hypothetical protein
VIDCFFVTFSGAKRANTNPINIRRYGRLLSESRKNEMAHRYLRRYSGDLCRLSAQEKTGTGIIFLNNHSAYEIGHEASR